MRETKSTCPYCGVGCGVIIEHDGAQIGGVRGDPEHPANFGRLCTKGSTLALTAAPHLRNQRALTPLRRAARGQALQPVGWDDALDEVASRLAATVTQHGPDSVGLYLSGQLLTEDYYVFNKLAKGLLGTNNVDTNSRLCMSSAVAGYKQSLGADAPPACYDDIGLARTIFITGSNMAWAHPVLFRRVEDARRANPELKLIVADPRRTETAAVADLHLALLPGTDVVLHHALLHVLLWEGLADMAFVREHTHGFEALRDRVREFTPAHAAKVCGLQADDIVQAARWFGGAVDGASERRTPTLSLYCQGLNQSRSGTDKNSTLINLHLATGQIGRPGAGPVLADRAAQRDGRARGRRPGQPAGRAPRPGQCRTPRRTGRAVGRGRHSVETRQERGRHVPGRGRRADQGAVDRLHQPGAVDARPGHRAPRAAARRVRRAAGGLPPHRHGRISPTCCCRPAAGAKRAAPSPTASAASAACAPRCRRRARRATTGASASTWRGGWKRSCRRAASTARRCSPTTRPRASGTNTATARAAATWTSPA